MISMLLTVAYLRYSLSMAVMARYRLAETKALYLAETGINREGIPLLPFLRRDTVLAGEGVDFKDMGQYRNVICRTYTGPYGQLVYEARGEGVVTYNNFFGQPVRIKRRAALTMVGEGFFKFMYFTNSEEPGGGPYTDGYVSFGSNDILEGIVHTNGHITISQYGCPTFLGDVYAVDGISYNGCEESFEGVVEDSADVRDYPPVDQAELTKSHARWIFTADDLLWRNLKKDTLIMTEIEFVTGGFRVSQWTYLIPPIAVEGPPPANFEWDTDVLPGLLDNNSIAFNAPFDSTLGYFWADSLFISATDIDGDDVTDIFDQYSAGDTLIIQSVDTLDKFWGGVITSTNVVGGNYIFGVSFWTQNFAGSGFAPGEEVQVSYKAPLDPTKSFNNFAYYHDHENSRNSYCPMDGFHHFDFEPPPGGPDVMPPTMFYAEEGVIYIRGGQVRIKGVVDGRFTIVTDDYTEYRRHDDPSIIDRVWGNIWLIDDIIYEDSNPDDGAVVYGTPNRLGLVAGGNVIIANTAANGGKNSTGGQDIVINAAILALHESFVCHYWQNSLTNTALNGPNFSTPSASKGDGRGPYRNPTSLGAVTTGTSDMRGTVYLYGSIAQAKRGYMRRNAPGPYPVTPGIGYYKQYHYDYNFSDFYGPPYFPTTSGEDGGAILVMRSYGELETPKAKETP
jgi:hypothetical protein